MIWLEKTHVNRPFELPTMSIDPSIAHTQHWSSETERELRKKQRRFSPIAYNTNHIRDDHNACAPFILSRFPFNVKIGFQNGDSAADILRNLENKLCQDAKRSRHPSRMEQNRAIRCRPPSQVMLWRNLESEVERYWRRSLFYTVKHDRNRMSKLKYVIHYAFSRQVYLMLVSIWMLNDDIS